MSTGYLALILHAHLPFVRHPDHDEFLEEDWLFEAITEAYIPLLARMERLTDEGVPFRLTMSVTPTLCAMLDDELLRKRYIRYLERAIGLAEQEIERNRDHEQLGRLARFYFDRFSDCRRRFVEQWRRDLTAAFRRLQEAGTLEIIASAATHAYLPLLQACPEALRAQILIGCDAYCRTFGRDPVGFWLPECGYAPGCERLLAEANLRWFVLDSHGLMFGNPRPRHAIYVPCYTPAGPAVFARDRYASREVWSATEGYPSDPAYRDFYRDLGFDRSHEELRPFVPAHGARKFTGLKYHRVTGGTGEEELYEPSAAEAAAEKHAADFVWKRRQQISTVGRNVPDPIIVAPFDAELFGHWWFEGPQFLDLLIRQAACDSHDFVLTTPSIYLAAHPTQQVIAPAGSSWGQNGYSEMWLNEKTAWIYPQLHTSARRMTAAANRFADTSIPDIERVLAQMARELLLAQSSDWAFLIKTGTAAEYATRRTNDHLTRFAQLHDGLLSGSVNEQLLAECESRDNIFPNLNWRYYAAPSH